MYKIFNLNGVYLGSSEDLPQSNDNLWLGQESPAEALILSNTPLEVKTKEEFNY